MKQYEEETSIEQIQKELDAINNLPQFNSEEYCMLIHGHGQKPREFYRELRSCPDIEYYWSKWSGPIWLFWLSFIPGQAGLISMKNKTKFKEIYLQMGELSMVTAILLPIKEKENMISFLKKSWKNMAIQYRPKLASFLIYEVDFDQNPNPYREYISTDDFNI